MAWAYRNEKFTADWVKDADWQIEFPGRLIDAHVQLRPWLR